MSTAAKFAMPHLHTEDITPPTYEISLTHPALNFPVQPKADSCKSLSIFHGNTNLSPSTGTNSSFTGRLAVQKLRQAQNENNNISGLNLEMKIIYKKLPYNL